VISPNGPWLVNGEPTVIHALSGFPNPGEQVKAVVYTTKKGIRPPMSWPHLNLV